MPTPSDARNRAAALAAGLYAHQVEGIAFLLGRRRSILADDMGLGKTRQSVLAMRESHPAGPYLVVCPASVKINWKREIQLVLPDAEVAIAGPAPLPPPEFQGWVVINYDILRKHPLQERRWAGLIFDEAHYLKNHRSQRHRYSVDLARSLDEAATVHLLTGTPLMNRPRDLFPLLQLVRHALGRSFVSFAKRYCDGHKGDYGWVADGASNIEELTVQLHGIMLRRTKNEVLDLPPKVRSWVEVEVASRVARQMSAAVTALFRSMSERSGDPGAGLPSSAPRRSRSGTALGQLSSARQRLAAAKVRNTIPFVENAIDQGEKVLVFSCFIAPIETMRKRFGERVVTLTGETPIPRRQEAVDRFQNDESIRLMAAQIVAGGVGLNLTAARQVVFNDLDWVPTNHWQAEDRAYRIGQQETVNVTYMVAEGTIDEFVRTVLESKSHIIDQLVDGAALPDELQQDVMGELRRVMGMIEPQLAKLRTEEVDEEQVAALLQAAAVELLARVLAGPVQASYRVESSSKPGEFYLLDVDGTDISCSCRGFSYRGNCQHARTLKQALVTGTRLPADFTRN